MKPISTLLLASLFCLLSASVIEIEIPDDSPDTTVINVDAQTMAGAAELVQEIQEIQERFPGFGPNFVPDPNHISKDAIEDHILQSIVKKVQSKASTMPHFQGMDRFALKETFNLLSQLRARSGRTQQTLSQIKMTPPSPLQQGIIQINQKETGHTDTLPEVERKETVSGNMKVDIQGDRIIVIDNNNNANNDNKRTDMMGENKIPLYNKILMPSMSLLILVVCAYLLYRYFKKENHVYKKENYDEETQRIVKGLRNLRD